MFHEIAKNVNNLFHDPEQELDAYPKRLRAGCSTSKKVVGGLFVAVMTLEGDYENCNYVFINAIHYACGFVDTTAPQTL